MKLGALVAVGLSVVVTGGCSAYGSKRHVGVPWSKAEIINGRTIVRVLFLDTPPEDRIDEAEFKRDGHRILLSLLTPASSPGRHLEVLKRQCVDVQFSAPLPPRLRLVDTAKRSLDPDTARLLRSERQQNPGPIQGPCRRLAARGQQRPRR